MQHVQESRSTRAFDSEVAHGLRAGVGFALNCSPFSRSAHLVSDKDCILSCGSHFSRQTSVEKRRRRKRKKKKRKKRRKKKRALRDCFYYQRQAGPTFRASRRSLREWRLRLSLLCELSPTQLVFGSWTFSTVTSQGFKLKIEFHIGTGID